MQYRRQFLKAGAALTLAPMLAKAQTSSWPQRPVRIVIPSAAGSPWDPLIRLMAERLSKEFGESFVVENRSGATGAIGMDNVVKAQDGHTLGLIFMPHVLTPALMPVPYNILEDVLPVTQVQWTYNALVVPPSLGVSTVAELVELARSKPGQLMFASGGNGTPAHITGEKFSRETGANMVHVPYRGPVLALQGMAGGQSDLSFASAASTVPHVQSGRLVALAVSSDERLGILPDVPTFAEAGYPQFASQEWAGIVMTKGTPVEVPQRLAQAIMTIIQDPEIVKTMAQQGSYLHGEGPEGLAALMKSELAEWGDLVKSLNITVG